jgi:TRAP transporter 4TM/12TM fusion protein
VVTTGTFTIPLMKRVGFNAEKSGAIEVAASTNGQIMPPVMGAAAFLMVEYLNISYLEVIKHAFLPAVLSYIGLMYLVHLEALKAGMQAQMRIRARSLTQRLLGWGLTLSGVSCFLYLAYWLLSGVDKLFGDYSFYANGGLILLFYGLLIYCEVRCGLKTQQDEGLEGMSVTTALLGGLHFLLPILVLVWCLMLLRLSPATAVFYSICLMVVIQLTQEGLRALFRRQSVIDGLRHGARTLVVGLENGARNMIGIGVATATAGIVVGTVSLTGIGQVMGELVETLSFGSVFLMLLLTALICMILGMGLPTTANYIVVSTLMAPVIVQLSAAHGLDIPLVAVHMFVFYFGILADDTPPVGLAAYAAAGISNGDPIRTGLQSFYYDIRTAILPFMFIFNTHLLMIGIDNPFEFLMVVAQGVLAMLLFVSATQGWLLVRNRLWETLVLLLLVFSFFRPDFWQGYFFPDKVWHSAQGVESHIDSLPMNAKLRLELDVEDDEGLLTRREIIFTKPQAGAGAYLERLGFITEPDGDTLRVIDIGFLSPAEQAGLVVGYDYRITGYYSNRPQPHSGWFLLPPLLLMGGIIWLQYRRSELHQQKPLGG